jgi:hypothetical protein
MEPLNENNNETTLKKESWEDWVHKNEIPILFVSFIIILIPFFLLKYDIIQINNPIREISIPNIDIIMNALSYVSSEELYNEFIETVTALTNETISKEEGLKVLEKLLQYKDYPSLIFDKNEFEEIVNKLIEEIKKL